MDLSIDFFSLLLPTLTGIYFYESNWLIKSQLNEKLINRLHAYYNMLEYIYMPVRQNSVLSSYLPCRICCVKEILLDGIGLEIYFGS